MKKSTLTIDPGIIPVALTLRRVEYILSGKIKPPLKELIWTYSKLKELAPEEDDLLVELKEHITKIVKTN